MFFQKKQDLFVGRFKELFPDLTIIHGFSTRLGGVSASGYSSLNLGIHSDDAPDLVMKNRKLFFLALGIHENDLVVPKQVHGSSVIRVESPGFYPETDGILTNKPGLNLSIQVADCLPVFLFDPMQRAIGLVHSGWHGSALGISKVAVYEMTRHFRTDPRDLQVFFGPSIGPCCYEVGEKVASKFSKEYISCGRLNLWQVNRDQLIEAGVLPERIIMSRLCTVCYDNLFYSHRAIKGKTGRMMAVLGFVNR